MTPHKDLLSIKKESFKFTESKSLHEVVLENNAEMKGFL